MSERRRPVWNPDGADSREWFVELPVCEHDETDPHYYRDTAGEQDWLTCPGPVDKRP